MTEPTQEVQQESGRLTKSFPVVGREIKFQAFSEAQFMQLAYEVAVYKKPTTEAARRAKSLDRVFRILLSIIVKEDDKEYVEDQMADGVVDTSDMLQIIKALMLPEENNNTGPKARRGRATQRQ